METGHAHLGALGIAWRLGVTLFFVLLNGFFVAAEFALVKVRVAQIESLATKGGASARIVQHMLKHLDRYLSGCQLGITLASLILGALGEPAVSVLLLAVFRAFGLEVSPDAQWVSWLAIGLAFSVITLLHMTVGEQAPKMWALRRPENVALMTAPPLRAFTWMFRPFIAVINSVSNAMLRWGGLKSDSGHEDIHTLEEIRGILSISASSGQISNRVHELTENVFRMTRLEVRHIVVARADMQILSLEQPLEENMRRIAECGHTRLPLCEVGLDTIIGFIHAKDVIEKSIKNQEIDLKGIARKAMFVPDTMPLAHFLGSLQAEQAQCAAVVDERGSVIGFAFREDALEEIVGPLGDEFDELDKEIREVSPGVFDVAGRVSIPEICDRLDFDIPEDEREDEDTIGGHVTARLGRLGQEGDTVSLGRYQATVTKAGPRRIERIRIEPAMDD